MSEHRHEHLTGEKPGSDRNQMILMVTFFVVWGVDSFLLRITTFLWILDYFWVYIIVGAVVVVVAAYFMDASHKDLFDTKVEGLATSGVFSRVRHPMYLGTHLFFLGLAIATFSLAAMALWVIIFAFYNTLANYEEWKLEERFGEEFLQYKQRVRKWVPL